MTGFLDNDAPSVQSEYVRYIEGDIFGKILFRNFALNIFNLSEHDIHVPLGKWELRAGDARVKIGDCWRDVEIKCARINIANKPLGYRQENWAFNNLLRTPSKKPKKFDLLFAVGVQILGVEHPDYWQYLKEVSCQRSAAGFPVSVDVLPHEPAYLRLCGLYLVPFNDIPDNHLRRHLKHISSKPLGNMFSWGWDANSCRELWKAVQTGVLASAKFTGVL